MTTENQTTAEPTAEEQAATAAAAAQAAAVKAGVGTDAALPVTTGEPKAPPAAPDPKADDKIEPIVYNPTGDAGLDMLLDTVGTLGLGPDHPAVVAAINGDFDLLALKLEESDIKGANRLIALGQKAFTDIRAKQETKRAADMAAVVGEAGGEESWKAIQKWANENADEGEQAGIKAALAAGGLQARMATAWLRSHYERASGVSDEGTGKPVAAEAKGTAATNAALSPREYGKAVAQARVGFKGDFENSEVYRGLQARRLAWRA